MASDDNDSLAGEARTKPSSEGSPRRKSSKKKSKTKDNNNNVITEEEPLDTNPVIRGDQDVMNQRNILAGYGARGERIKHTVQDGALQMPREAWNMIKETTKETGETAADKYSLPLIDSVLRPSMDPKITKLHVTKLEMEKVEVVQQPQVDATMLMYLQQMGQPMPQAKVVKVLQPKATNSVIRRVPVNAEAERIRGGGGEDESGVAEQAAAAEGEAAQAAPTTEAQPEASEGQPKPEEAPPATTPYPQATVPTAGETPVAPVAEETAPPSDAAVAGAPIVPAETGDTVEKPVAEVIAAKPAEEAPVPMDVDAPAANDALSALTNAAAAAAPASNEANASAPAAAPGETKATEGDAPAEVSAPSAMEAEASASTAETAPEEANGPEGDAPAATAETLQEGAVPQQQDAAVASESAPMDAQPPSNEDKAEVPAAPAATENAPTAPAPAAAPEAPSNTEEVPAASTSVVASEAPSKPEDTPAAPASAETKPEVATAPTVAPAATPMDVETPKTETPSAEAQNTAPAAAAVGSETSPPQAAAPTSDPAAAPPVPAAAPTAPEAQAPAGKVASAEERPRGGKGGKNFVKMEESNAQAAKKEEKEKEGPPAQPLESKPKPEWEQHKPGPNDETVTPLDQLPERPEWYKKDSISDIEKSMLPEWFDSSSSHRTPETYMKARETAVKMSDTMANRNVTSSMMRRSIVGDAGSLLRLRDFLVHWGIINEDAINDSAPTPAGLRPNLKRPKEFSEDMRSDLISAVVQQAKRQKVGADADGDHGMGVESSSSFIPINWDEVADKVGHGASADECQKNFMLESLETDASGSSVERPVTPDASKPSADESKSSSDAAEDAKVASKKQLLEGLVQQSKPEVLGAVFDAAVKATDGKVAEAQSASLLGLQLSRQVEEARSHEVDLAEKLGKLVDMRMKKLENRMAMMDDVESMLEAEKVALELERRDLYTARCRHWFGGA